MGVTYYRKRALLAFPPGRLRRLLTVPAEQVRSQVRTGQRTTAILKNKTPTGYPVGVFFFRSLAMTYSHMGKPHTTIGDAPFHC